MGPFYDEVGFEALYWQPFVAGLMRDGIKAGRLIPISRGGASVWYGTPQGLELYAMRTPQQIRLEVIKKSRRYNTNKSTHVSAFDRAIYRDAAQTLNLSAYRTLHPAWMYRTLWRFWGGLEGLEWLQPRIGVSILPPPPLPDGLALPPQFVAAKFYWRSTFAPGPVTVNFVEACLGHVSKTLPVILLDTPFHVDDHADCDPPAMPNVQRLSQLYPGITVETALAVQSAVLARAVGYVGTYGGLSHLALRFGRPSVSVYEQWQGAALPHKHLCDAIGMATGVPTHVFNLGELPTLSAALPPVQVQIHGDAQQFDTAPRQPVGGPA